MDPFLLVLAFIIWAIASAAKSRKRRPGESGGEETARRGRAEDKVSDWMEEGQRRALEALRRWEQRQRELDAERGGKLPRVTVESPAEAPGSPPDALAAPRRPGTRARVEEAPPEWWEDAPKERRPVGWWEDQPEEARSLEREEEVKPVPAPSPRASAERRRTHPPPARRPPAPPQAAVVARRGPPATVGREPAGSRRARRRRARLPAAGRLGRLPPLQRALVLSEVLRAPLALRDPETPLDR